MAKKTQAQTKDAAKKAQAAKAQATQDQAAKDQADKAAKDQADQAAQDQAAKDQAAKDQAAKDQADMHEGVALSTFDVALAFSAPRAGYPVDPERAQELWDNNGCDDLPAKLAVAVFDCLLQQGEKITTRLLSKVSQAAIQDEDDAVAIFLAWRLRRYAHTANSANKMVEWSRHILAVQAFTLIELSPIPEVALSA